jgi:hypothetical protein
MIKRHKFIPSGNIACRHNSDTALEPIVHGAAKVGYGFYCLTASIRFTFRSFGWACAHCMVHALPASRQQGYVKTTCPTANRFAVETFLSAGRKTMAQMQPIQCCFASTPVFRCCAPEPRLTSGSASGASTFAQLGKASRAPRGNSCACGGEIGRGSAPHRRVQQAPRLAGGAGQTLPHEIWLSRRHRAGGAARSGASAPEALGCEIISSHHSIRLGEPEPHTADHKSAISWAQNHLPIWHADPSGLTFGGGHA